MAAVADATPDLERLANGARTIEELARSDIGEDEFARRFLDAAMTSVAARAGIFWALNQDGLIAPLGSAGLDHAPAGQSPGAERLRIQQVLDTLRERQSAHYAPIHPSGDAIGGWRLVVPMVDREVCCGAIELDFGEAETEEAESLQFLEEMGLYAARYFRWRRELASVASHLEFSRRFQAATLKLHQALDPKEIAAVAAHDGRPLLGCDRVAIAVRDGSRCTVLAVSGNGRVNRRSNLVRRMTDLADRVIRSNLPLSYAGTLEGVCPALSRSLVAYIDESGARALKAVPLAECSASQSPSKPFGVLLVEQLSDAWLTPLVAERTDRFSEHVAAALLNARAHQEIILLPLWTFLGRSLSRLRGRRLLQFLAGLLLSGALVSGLVLIPSTYRVEAGGRLMPAVGRRVFAATDGEVVEIHVRSGARVEAGQPLLRLRNEDLHARWIALHTDLDEQQQRRSALQAELDALGATASRDQAVRLRGQLAQAAAGIRGLETRLQSLSDELNLLTVTAPAAGTVATFEIESTLRDRPVRRGDLLLEIMDEDGQWQLELEVPAHRIGHLFDAQVEAGSGELPVEFVLATDPERSYRGRLRTVATRTDFSARAGSVVKLRASIDEQAVPRRYIGAEATAKIACGERSLAYVLFGDLVEFVRGRLW